MKAFGIENGALHLELRLTQNGWKLIEINPRISGGAMNNMLQALGFSLVEETLKILLENSLICNQDIKICVYKICHCGK